MMITDDGSLVLMPSLSPLGSVTKKPKAFSVIILPRISMVGCYMGSSFAQNSIQLKEASVVSKEEK